MFCSTAVLGKNTTIDFSLFEMADIKQHNILAYTFIHVTLYWIFKSLQMRFVRHLAHTLNYTKFSYLDNLKFFKTDSLITPRQLIDFIRLYKTLHGITTVPTKVFL